MATITTLNPNDSGAVSRGTINTNLTNLNTDKIETSVLDTDVTLAANSDLKVATQRAVKTYADSRTGYALYSFPTRLMATVYQNTSGKPIFVSVAFTASVTSGNTAGIQTNLGLTASPSDIVSTLRHGGNAGPANQGGSMTFYVPNNYYYSVTGNTGNYTVTSWVEYAN